MATGSVAYEQVQIGKETVWGTKVPATKRWMGVTPDSRFTPSVKNTQKHYLNGTFQPMQRVVQTFRDGKCVINGDFTFEDWLYVPLCGISGGVVGTTVAAHKEWIFPFNNTTAVPVESRTIEATDGNDPYAFSGCNCISGELSGGSAEDSLVQFKSTWAASKAIQSAITPALVDDATVDFLPAMNMALYADALGGTIGTTVLPITLISWKLAWAGWVAQKRRAGGTAPGGVPGPAGVQYNIGTITLEIEAESNTASKAEVTAYLAGAGRLVQLIGKGPVIATTEYKTLNIQMAGDWVGDPSLWENDKSDTKFKMTLHPRYDPGSFAHYAKITVWNNLAAAIG